MKRLPQLARRVKDTDLAAPKTEDPLVVAIANVVWQAISGGLQKDANEDDAVAVAPDWLLQSSFTEAGGTSLNVQVTQSFLMLPIIEYI